MLILDSSYSEMEKLEPYVNDLKDDLNFGNEDFNRIMLSLSEAVTNAIVHGNKERNDRNVTIRSSLSDNTLTITVKDEGKGFNPDELPDPLKEENLMKEGGRGVFLIRQYADDILYSNGGTKLTMKFQLSG